jgi:hypothetical protein
MAFGCVHTEDGYFMDARFSLEGGVRLQSIRRFIETFSVAMIHFEAFGASGGI